MRYSKFAKTAAVVCGIILLVMIGIAASVKQTQEIPKRDDIVAGKTNIIAGIVTAQPGEKVEFPIYVVNNAHGGFAIAGIIIGIARIILSIIILVLYFLLIIVYGISY